MHKFVVLASWIFCRMLGFQLFTFVHSWSNGTDNECVGR